MLYFLFLVSLTLYFFLHSWLASKTARSIFVRSGIIWSYRIFYNIFSLITLIPIFLLYLGSEHRNYLDSDLIKLLGLAVVILGLLLFRSCIPLYNWHQFSGLTSSQKTDFVRKGILGRLRHPLYLATILFVGGICMIELNLWSISAWLIMVWYILIGIKLEEKKLIEEHGTKYINYRKEVPMLIPRLRRN